MLAHRPRLCHGATEFEENTISVSCLIYYTCGDLEVADPYKTVLARSLLFQSTAKALSYPNNWPWERWLSYSGGFFHSSFSDSLSITLTTVGSIGWKSGF